MKTSPFLSLPLQGEGRNQDFCGTVSYSSSLSTYQRYPSPTQSVGERGWGVRVQFMRSAIIPVYLFGLSQLDKHIA
jgi:hypothetical protein